MFESIFNGKTVQYEIYYYYLDLKPVDTLETSGITWVYQRFLWNKNKFKLILGGIDRGKR